MQRSQNSGAAAICAESHIIRSRRRLNDSQQRNATSSRDLGIEDRIKVGGHMEHVSGHNTFNVLFMVSFFASFVVVMLHFG